MLFMTETEAGFSAGVSSPLKSKMLQILLRNNAEGLWTYLAVSSDCLFSSGASLATFSLADRTGVTSGDSDSS